MASIVVRTAQDGSKTFQVKVRLRGYPTQSATFDRKTDATRWAAQTESAIREGRHFKTSTAKKHTLTQLIDRYIRDILPRKPKSYSTQIIQLQWWKSQIGSYTLADVTPALIVEQRDILAKGITSRGSLRSNATVRRYLAILSHAFSIAVNEWQWCEDNPLRKVSKPSEGRGRIRFLSDEERIRLLQECKNSSNPYLYTIVVLCLATGARKMEILGLKWDQVDFNRQVITIHETKNGEIKVLPLVGHALTLLRDHAKVRRIDTDLVFAGQKGRKTNAISPVVIKRAWETALNKSMIENFRFHDLRHSAASYLAMNGATLAEIAEVLGHKTLQMVKRYAHLSESHTSKVVAKMNEKIFGG